MGKIDRLDKIHRSKKKAALTGPSSQLKAIEEWFIDNAREQDVGRNDDGAEGAI